MSTSLLRNIVTRVAENIQLPLRKRPLETRIPRNLRLETLEPRILFSGTPAPAPEPEPAPEPASQEAPTPEPESTAPSAESADPPPVAAPPEASEAESVDTTADAGEQVTALALTQEQLDAVVEAATQRWIDTGITAEQESALRSATYQIADLGTSRLGVVYGSEVTIDDDAAGNGGWFIDESPQEDSEYTGNANSLSAAPTSVAAGRYDLLSVVLHEQGHLLGIPDSVASNDVMFEVLTEGTRLLPASGQAAGATPGAITGVEFMSTPIATFNFESPGGYALTDTTNSDAPVTEISDGSGDFFIRTDGSNIGSFVNYSGQEGSFYFAVMDTNGETPNSDQLRQTFTTIDITGFTNLHFSVLVAEDDNGTAQNWDDDSSLLFEYSIDGGAWQNLLAFEAVGGTNTEPAQDTDFDGVGDGAALTDVFTQFTANIAGTGSNLVIRANYDFLEAGDEDVAIDNLIISGDPTTAGGLIISEVVDATLPNGLPKYVELTNIGSSTIDLSNFSIGNFNNGGTTLGGSASTVLSGMLAPGSSYIISYENGDGPGVGSFFDTYGFDPDNFDLGSFINGDDVIVLFDGPATGDGTDANIVDIYGVIGTDGSGEVWEYTDGYSQRLSSVTAPNPIFDPAEWNFGGANSLETGDDVTEEILIQTLTNPGTPGTAATGGLVISEIMYNPGSAEDDWEWVEVVNTGGTDIDLSGYVIDDINSVALAGANIASGIVAAGASAVLYNADDLTAADFAAAWGNGINLIGVTNWSSMALNNSGDTVSIWDSFANYSGDNTTHANAITGVTFTSGSGFPSSNNSASIFLTDLASDPNNGANWQLSADGLATPAGGPGYTSTTGGGNLGSDVGSPGGMPASDIVISEIMFNPNSPEDDWEWIEIFNTGSSTIDLSGYVVDDNNGVSHGAANIASGLLNAGESAVLFNADDLSVADFEAAWGAGINLIPVTNWSAMALNNGGDQVGIWSSSAAYGGDDSSQFNVITSVNYGVAGFPSGDNAGSIFLTDLAADASDGANWQLSTDGATTPVGDAYTSTAGGTNTGLDIGSPGGTPAGLSLVISEIMFNPDSSEDDWEWVEIANTGTTDIDLSGFVIDDINSVAHGSSNIAAGTIVAGGTGVLFNVDDVSLADFAAAWGAGINLIPVTNWSAMALNNGGDTIGIWDSFTSYSGDHDTHANSIVSVAYDDSGAWPSDDGASSIFLTDLAADPNDGANWQLSSAGTDTPAGGAAYTSASLGGNGGADVGSPGGNFLQISEIMFNPASAEDDWEWVEIANTGTSTIDLSGYVIDDINGVAHGSANIAAGTIAGGGTAVLFNADDLSIADFEAAWGTGINLIPVTNWSAMALNNGGDTVGIWDSFTSYSGDNTTHANAVISVAYQGSSPWPSDDGNASFFLTDLAADPNDGANWMLSTDGTPTPAGGEAYTSAAGGGNVGGEVASPGGTLGPEINVVGINTEDIADGDLTSSPLDGTDFGSADVLTSQTIVRTFTVENLGSLPLTISGVTISGPDAGAFSLTTPPSGTLAPGASTTFDITFSPTRAGRHDATIEIASDDADETPFDFAIEGNGTVFRDLSDEPDLSTVFTQIGGLGAGDGLVGAEISAFDPGSNRLFTTSEDGLQVIDLSDPANPTFVTLIEPTADGGQDDGVTSVAVNDAGIIAIGVPSNVSTDPGDVLFYDAATLGFLGSVGVGVLPDMVTFTNDGMKVMVANEAEPDGTDPEGSVSIINISGGVGAATVQTATFTAFNGTEDALRRAGVKITPGQTAAQDFEPEYIAISPDDSKAWVTLQENNAIAIIDIATATVDEIVPLGLKDFNMPFAQIDPTNNSPDELTLGNHPIFGMYQPDAITSYMTGGQTYYITANEGDARDAEETEIKDETLDPTLFPDAATFQQDGVAGELEITNIFGDVDGDGDFDKIHAFGARSFSIFNSSGELIFDSGDVLARAADAFGLYDDGRSDNKGTEPEGVTVGMVNGEWLAFVGLERANAVAVFNVSDPTSVSLVQVLNDAADVSPEGLFFIPASESPNGSDLLVVSNEVSTTIRVWSNDVDTFVSVNGDGDLVIRDVNDPNNDRISVSSDGSNLIIRDPFQTLRTDVPGATEAPAGTLNIPLSAFNNLIIQTEEGNDIIDVQDLTGFTGDLTIDGGDDFDTVNFRADANVGSADLSGDFLNFFANSGITSEADGGISLNADQKVFLNYFSQLQGGSEGISIIANGEGETSGNFVGVDLRRATLSTTAGGNIVIDGVGGDGGGGNRGVHLWQSTITSLGELYIDGESQGGTNYGNGVAFVGGTTTATGDIVINGTGDSEALGNLNSGVTFDYSASIESTEGMIMISGTAGGGNSNNVGVSANRGVSIAADSGLGIIGVGNGLLSGNRGVYLANGVFLDAGSGALSILGTATQNTSATGNLNTGVEIIRSEAQAGTTATVQGTGGYGAHQNKGVALTSVNLTAGDDVLVEGTGGDATGNANGGVEIGGASSVESTGGTFTINGTATGGVNSNVGVSITQNSSVTGSGVTVSGQGAGTGSNNAGVKVSSSDINAGGNPITIDGTGSPDGTGVSNHGVEVTSGSTLTGSGSSLITGTGGTGTNSFGAYMTGVLGNLMASNVMTDPDTDDQKVGDFFNILPVLPLLAAEADRRTRRRKKGIDPSLESLFASIDRYLEPSRTNEVAVLRLHDGFLSLNPISTNLAELEAMVPSLPDRGEFHRRVLLITSEDDKNLSGVYAEIGIGGEVITATPLEQLLEAAICTGEFFESLGEITMDGENDEVPRWSSYRGRKPELRGTSYMGSEVFQLNW